jgi:transcriptional regulator with XRE-family HTH domain
VTGIKRFMARQTQPGDLGRILREARKARGLTQATLAEQAGIDQTTISKIEGGGRVDPSLSTIAALERVLSVSLNPPAMHPSLARFLGSPLAERLGIEAAEAQELAALDWWGHGDPTDDEWYDFVRLRRTVAGRARAPR